mgnify:FL=1
MSMHLLSTRSSYAHKYACCFNRWDAGGSIACGTFATHYKLNVLIFSSKSLNGDIGAVRICSSWLVFHKKVVRSLTLKGNSSFYVDFCLDMLGGNLALHWDLVFSLCFMMVVHSLYGSSLEIGNTILVVDNAINRFFLHSKGAMVVLTTLM